MLYLPQKKIDISSSLLFPPVSCSPNMFMMFVQRMSQHKHRLLSVNCSYPYTYVSARVLSGRSNRVFTERHKSAMGGCAFDARLSSLLNGCQCSINSTATANRPRRLRRVQHLCVHSSVCDLIDCQDLTAQHLRTFSLSTYVYVGGTRQKRSLYIFVTVLIFIHILLNVLFHFTLLHVISFYI